MWVSLKNENSVVKINTDFITLLYPENKVVVLSSGNELALSDEDYDELQSMMFPTRKKVAKEDANLAEFLNTLHRLTGGKNSAILTPQRNKKLTALMRLMSNEQLMTAAKNIANDKFLQGENDTGTRYGNLDYLLSNDKKGNSNAAKWAEYKQDDKRKKMF